jgi:hypothetical protein
MFDSSSRAGRTRTKQVGPVFALDNGKFTGDAQLWRIVELLKTRGWGNVGGISEKCIWVPLFGHLSV